MTIKIILFFLIFLFPFLASADIDNTRNILTSTSITSGSEWFGQRIWIDDGKNEINQIRMNIARLTSGNPTSNLTLEICQFDNFNFSNQSCSYPIYKRFFTTTDIINNFSNSAIYHSATSSPLLTANVCLESDKTYLIGFRASSTINSSLQGYGNTNGNLASSTYQSAQYSPNNQSLYITGWTSGNPYSVMFYASTSYNSLCETNICEECETSSTTECNTAPIFVSSTIVQIFIISLIIFISGMLIISSKNYAIQ